MSKTGKASAKRATTKKRGAGSKGRTDCQSVPRRKKKTGGLTPSRSPSRTDASDDIVLLAEPLTEPPAAPQRLGSHGRQCWERIVPLLVELRLLTALHLEALEALCHQWHDYLTWHLAIQADPDKAIVEFDSGARQKSPEATLRDSAYDRWLKLLPRFGLSPEHLRKLKRLKEPAPATGRGSRARDDFDPVAAFARQKYEE